MWMFAYITNMNIKVLICKDICRNMYNVLQFIAIQFFKIFQVVFLINLDIAWILHECQKETLQMLRIIVVTLADRQVVPGVTRLILQLDGNIVISLFAVSY